jgi:hypothetical protein
VTFDERRHTMVNGHGWRLHPHRTTQLKTTATQERERDHAAGDE